MSAAREEAPFSFEVDGYDLVDRTNGLRLHCYQWPEYEFTVSVEPLAGKQADAWPVSARSYFEFGSSIHQEGGEQVCTLAMAIAHQPFERDYPGRTDELLDIVLPLIMPMDLLTFPRHPEGVQARIPEAMRSLLRTRGSYFRHRDEPGTRAYREAHPTALDIACWSKNPVVSRSARMLRSIRDSGERE